MWVRGHILDKSRGAGPRGAGEQEGNRLECQQQEVEAGAGEGSSGGALHL